MVLALIKNTFCEMNPVQPNALCASFSAETHQIKQRNGDLSSAHFFTRLEQRARSCLAGASMCHTSSSGSLIKFHNTDIH